MCVLVSVLQHINVSKRCVAHTEEKKNTLTKNSTAIFDIFFLLKWSFDRRKKHKYTHTSHEWVRKLEHCTITTQQWNWSKTYCTRTCARVIAHALLVWGCVCLCVMISWLERFASHRKCCFLRKNFCDDLRSWAFGKWSNERTLSLTFVWSSTSCITSHYDSVCALCLIARSIFLFYSLLVDSLRFTMCLLSQRSHSTFAACILVMTKDMQKFTA